MQLKRNKEMEFETLKKNHKKQLIIGSLAICVIGGAITYATSRAFYKVDGSIDLAKGTVNYKPYDFKIMAMYKSEDGTNYTEIIDRMPSSGYVINEDKSYCTIDNKTNDTNAILKTIEGHHIIENLTKYDKCYLYFDKKTYQDVNDILAINNPKTSVPDFSKMATTDEGVYAVSDGMYGGTSYYWRGAVTTNHVIFANKCWRIVRINGDKTIRLIYNGAVQTENTCKGNGENSNAIATSASYNSNGNAAYIGWTFKLGYQRPSVTASEIETDSNAKVQIEKWYNNNIGNNVIYDLHVADGKFCNDRNTKSNVTWNANSSNNYETRERKLSNNPTLNCSTVDTYILKIGVITSDEAIYAGGGDTSNKYYYLYIGVRYWTMSPTYGNGYNDYADIMQIYSDGQIIDNISVSGNHGLRPVINLKSDTIFKSNGNGTLDNPYVVQ